MHLLWRCQLSLSHILDPGQNPFHQCETGASNPTHEVTPECCLECSSISRYRSLIYTLPPWIPCKSLRNVIQPEISKIAFHNVIFTPHKTCSSRLYTKIYVEYLAACEIDIPFVQASAKFWFLSLKIQWDYFHELSLAAMVAPSL